MIFILLLKILMPKIKADVLGLLSEDYLKGYVRKDEFYKGGFLYKYHLYS